MSNDVIVELEATDKKYKAPSVDERLVEWITSLVEPWRNYRDTNFKDRWDEYYRLWRGIFRETDRTRKSERSKLISPALQQAIELTVAEIEEAFFGKGKWFDISQDVIDAANPEQVQRLGDIRQRLQEDMDRANIKGSCSEAFLYGCLFGNGIGKIAVDKRTEYTLNEKLQLTPRSRWIVELVAVDPREFLTDPTARTIDESIGSAHELIVPKVDVLRKMEDGIYKTVELGDSDDSAPDEEYRDASAQGRTKLLEYHGLVPKSLIPLSVAPDEEFADLSDLIEGKEDDNISIANDELVEAIVVIANEGKLIKAVENPLPRNDRAFISYQHDTVPNRFVGRGVAEKGYNPQKALDSELRARMDSMAYAVHPMMAADSTRLPRGQSLSVEPGKTFLTTGDPSTVFFPFKFGSVDANTFPQAQDLERMVQMGTGAIDTASVGAGMIGDTVGGLSLLTAATIKRTKRTLANIERNFMHPLIQKVAWRYFHFDKERYPIPDMKFTVQSSMGMMAKELEQQQFANMLKTVPADSPAYWMLMRGLYENASISNREEMLGIIGQMMQQAMAPKEPPPPDPMVEVTREDIQSRERIANQRAKIDLMRVRAELLRARISVRKSDAEEAKLDSETALNLAKAEREAFDMEKELSQFLKEVDSLKEQSTEEESLDERNIDAGEISE